MGIIDFRVLRDSHEPPGSEMFTQTFAKNSLDRNPAYGNPTQVFMMAERCNEWQENNLKRTNSGRL